MTIFGLVAAMALTGSQLGLAFEKPKDEGIGGTGMVLSPSPDGIGGTGIIGTITGFGSIFVNGLEIDYDNNQRILVDDVSASAKTLKIGHIAKIVATNDANRLVTHSISIEHEVIGQISAINGAQSKATVFGQEVAIAQDTSAPPMKIGDWVAVSGLRRLNGTIYASLIEPSVKGKFQIIGDRKQRARALATLADSTSVPAVALSGTGRKILRGTSNEASIAWKLERPQPLFSASDNVSRIIAEKFVSDTDGALRGDSIAGLRITPSAGASILANGAEQRAIIEIENDDHGTPVVNGFPVVNPTSGHTDNAQPSGTDGNSDGAEKMITKNTSDGQGQSEKANSGGPANQRKNGSDKSPEHNSGKADN